MAAKITARSVVGHTAQFAGWAAAMCGVFLMLGLAWTLVIGGVAAFGVGVLIEGGRV